MGIFRTFASTKTATLLAQKPASTSNSSRSSLGGQNGNHFPPVQVQNTGPDTNFGQLNLRELFHSLAPLTKSVVYSELEALKNKVHQLEATLAPKQIHPPHAPLPPMNVSRGMPSMNASPGMLPGFSNEEPAKFGVGLANSPTFIGINPYNQEKPHELVDLYGGYTPIYVRDQSRQINYGPFAWLSFMRKDKALTILWNYMRDKKHLVVVTPLVPDEPTKARNNSARNLPIEDYEVEFRKKALDRDGDNDVAPFRQQGSTNNEMRIQMNKNALLLGLTFFEGEVDQKLQLLEKITMMLPTKKSVWLLISRFFKSIYPFIPLIDEDWFRHEIQCLLGPEVYADEKFEEIRMGKRLDLATLGILLIILRLSYLSSFSNNKLDNEKALETQGNDLNLAEMKYILTNPITLDVINLAQLCLDQFDIYRRTNITVLQCAVMMRIYHMFAPEDGDGSDGGESHVFNAVCLQTAYCMGLNREPNNFDDVCNDEKVNNLSRKLWYFLKMMDMNLGHQYGLPLLVDDNYNDVSVPFYTPGNSNVYDANMERAVCHGLSAAEITFKDVRHILQRSLSIKDRLKMSELTELLTKFECNLQERYGTLTDYSKTPATQIEFPFIKVLKCKAYMNFKSFTMSMFFHFFLNYEKSGETDLSFFYLRKYFALSCGEFIPEYLDLVRNNRRNFDANSTIPDLILTPSLEFIIHKTNQLNFSILIRVNCAIAQMKANVELHSSNLLMSFEYKLRFARLTKLSKMMEKFIKYGNSCLSRLSSRYYYAWRIYKAHSYIVNLLTTDEFYAHLIAGPPIAFFTFTTEQLSELLLIADSTLWRIKSVVQQNMPADSAGPTPDPLTLDSPPDNQYAPPQFSPDVNVQTSTTASSGSSFDLDDFLPESNSEIDKLWLQLTTIKNDNRMEENRQQRPAQFEGDREVHMPTYDMPPHLLASQPAGAGNFDNVFDIFSGVPF